MTTTIYTGGAEAMLVKLVKNFDKARFACAVIVLAGRSPLADELERAGAIVVILGLRSTIARLFAIVRVVSAARSLRPDVLQGWMLHGNLAAQLAGTVLRVPVVWGVRHSKLLPGRAKRSARFLAWAMKYLSGLAERIVYNSDEGRLHHETLGYNASKSLVIRNGFNLSQFVPDESARDQHRAALGIAAGTAVIGMVARYHPMKDHATLLNAARLLRQSHADVRFALIGRGCDPGNRVLLEEINRLELGSTVLLLGERTDVHSLANAFDIGTLSSASEGFPNVIGEIMSCGIPCVVTDVGESSHVVGDTGISVPPSDPAALAGAWARLIELGSEGRRRLGHEARARIETHFSIEPVSRRFEALYLESTSQRTSTTR